MARRSICGLFLIVVVVLVVPEGAEAQVDGYHFTGINFNFANPGARARGIGGAFVALADDATTALANPAGLAFLDRQFSLEFTHDEERAPVGQVTQGGMTTSGEIPFLTFTAENDPFRVWGESESNRINYASFVFPVASRKIGLALYYASLADLNQEYEVGAGMMCVDGIGSPYLPGAGESCQLGSTLGDAYVPQSVTAALETRMLGGGFGWKLGDTFSVGVSAAYVETTFGGQSVIDHIPGLESETSTLSSSVEDQDVLYSLGVLYRGNVLGFGLSYRSKSTFEIDNDYLDDNDEVIPGRSFEGEFVIPERIAAGFAIFPGDHWVIAGEYVRIPYSDMPKGMVQQFDGGRQGFGVEYASADVDEFHVGFEYTTFSNNKGWSIRLGYWRDQTHLIYSSQGYTEPIQTPGDRVQAAAALLYQEFELEFDHFTAGIGAAFGTFRLDAAVDYSSDAGTDFLVSGVIYF